MQAQELIIRALESQKSGQTDQAIALFQEALKLAPGNAHALYSLSLIAFQAGDLESAYRHSSDGLHASPQFAPLWFLHGTIQQTRGELGAALESFDSALAADPDYVDVLLNSGALLRSQFRHREALERFNRILTVKPDHTGALVNCGILLTEFKQSEQAIRMFERLTEIAPDYDYALGLLFYERMHICDWRGFDTLSAEIIDGVRQGKRVCKSLAFMSVSDSAQDHLQAATIFARHYCPPAPQTYWNGERYQHTKLRVAYVSPDFREHPVSHLLAGVLEQHDKDRFETIAISLGIDDSSRLRERLLKAFDKFIDARHLSAQQIAKLMREMEVDIAVDLGGYTSDTRTAIFSYRPAPVQVNYLGYPGSMGVSYYDYIVADRHVIPVDQQMHFSEKVAYLPDSYLPIDNTVQIAERTPTRQECGLPEEAFVFCSFSHDYKISPPVFDVWMRLLTRVPGSVLWLVTRGEMTQRNLRQAAQARGVDPNRLVFASRVPRVEDHLARYRQADLFLDTNPYNAHTTAADALMAGLPVVTYMGSAFPSRVAGSLLYAAGLPELVANSLMQYESIALLLSTDTDRLAEIKMRLRDHTRSQPLFNTTAFCRNWEELLTKLTPCAAGAV